MASEYLKEVLAFIQATSNTPAGIAKIVATITGNLDAADAEEQDLAQQRKTLSRLLSQ